MRLQTTRRQELSADNVSGDEADERDPFVEGTSLVQTLPLVPDDPEMADLFGELTKPVVASLAQEFDVQTGSGRILVELAAASYVDATLARAAYRRAAARDRDPAFAAAAAKAGRQLDDATRRTIAAIELLRRPSTTRVSIREAERMHVGDQVVAIGQKKRGRK